MNEAGRYLFSYENWVEGNTEEEAKLNFLAEMKNDDNKFIDCLEFQSKDEEFY